jgi:Fic family protein
MDEKYYHPKMKGIVVKNNKGIPAYYFELFILTPKGKRGISKYLGRKMPSSEELAPKIFDYYQEFGDIVKTLVPQSTKDYFKYTGLNEIEKNRFRYWGLKHELNKKKLDHFQVVFMILFILNSARAEGSRMKKEDLEHSIANKKPKSFEQREALNTLMAIRWAFSDQFTWSTLSIRKLHGILFDGIEPDLAGKYKPYDNVVGSRIKGEIIETTPYQKVPEKMRLWVEEVKKYRKKIYPPVFALESHLKFESIHPFHDGNGRIGRILLNRLLLENSFMPVIFFEENHQAYCNSISLAREGRKDKYIKLFVKQLKKTWKVFCEEEENKEFVSTRKKLAISLVNTGKRNVVKFGKLPPRFK